MDASSKNRGRFELMFSQIGGAVIVGGAIGGTTGLYKGITETNVQKLTGAVRRTQMLNFLGKDMARSAQTLGVVALLYSIFGTVISKARGAEDELNTISAGTLTGMLYRASGGLKAVGRGGAIGFIVSSAYCAYSSYPKWLDMVKGQ